MARANLDQAPHERGLDEYPPEWQEEFRRLSDVVMSLANRYQDSILIHIWDPRSLQGLWKSIRYGVHRYPTFVIEKQRKITGLDTDLLDSALQTYLAKIEG